jgi:hypothetical protein
MSETNDLDLPSSEQPEDLESVEGLAADPESIDFSPITDEIVAAKGDVLKSEISAEFGRNDFPENPDWLLTKDMLVGGPKDDSIEYRKNSEPTNRARAMDALKESGLSLDRQLAITAAVSTHFIPEKGTYAPHFLRTMAYNPQLETVTVTYNRSPYLFSIDMEKYLKAQESFIERYNQGEREAQPDFEEFQEIVPPGLFTHTFTREDIDAYHIPTLASHTSDGFSELYPPENPQQELYDMAMKEGSSLTVSRYAIDKGFLAPDMKIVGLAIHQKGSKKILARFSSDKVAAKVAS